MHEVQSGDTIGDIALIYGYTWQDIPYMLEINDMSAEDIRLLKPGSVFLVPPKDGTFTPIPPTAEAAASDTPARRNPRENDHGYSVSNHKGAIPDCKSAHWRRADTGAGLRHSSKRRSRRRGSASAACGCGFRAGGDHPWRDILVIARHPLVFFVTGKAEQSQLQSGRA